MRLFTGKLRKLEAIFRKVYLEQDNIDSAELDEVWQANVMRRIRQQGPLNDTKDFLLRFQQTAWRLAPVTCLLIIALALWSFQMDVTSEYEMAAFVFDDPMGFGFIELSGV
jgi:hypothetical protein